MNKYKVTADLEHNKQVFSQIFSDCADIKMIDMQLGAEEPLHCMVAYIEVVAAAERTAQGNTAALRTAGMRRREIQGFFTLPASGDDLVDRQLALQGPRGGDMRRGGEKRENALHGAGLLFLGNVGL